MILFLTNADTEILGIRMVLEGLPSELGEVQCANPIRSPEVPDLTGVGAVIVRLLGGRRAWEDGFGSLREECVRKHVPLLAFGGEAGYDVELANLSTAEPPIVSEAFRYLVHGGPANLENLLLFVGDRVLGLGLGHAPPAAIPTCGVMGEPVVDPARPTVAVVFYRAQFVAGNVLAIRDLCRAIERRGVNAIPIYCYSLRDAAGEEAVSLLESVGVDALVTTVWAAGSSADGGDGWDVTRLASLDVPVLQAIAATCSSADWEASSIGLGPMDVAMSMAIPEFDGRIISVPFSFKETVDDGEEIGTPVTAYRSVPDRVERVAGLACRLASLRRVPPAERRISIVLSAYPTKRSRLGNAVGLDTPASAIRLLESLRDAGYRVGRVPAGGDELMSELASELIYDPSSLRSGGERVFRLPGSAYAEWFAGLDKELRDRVVEAWGEPPGDLFVDRETGDLLYSGIDLSCGENSGTAGTLGGSGAVRTVGRVFVAVQPPRGFGENPVAVYHSPDLPPTHHYLGFYRWLAGSAGTKDGPEVAGSAGAKDGPEVEGSAGASDGFGAHVIIHLGKHGTLEWLPGKGAGMSAGCAPDAALGEVPLVYPFVVNDPGEGAQAKRRAHAVIVDHLVPPMTRAGTYDDLAAIEAALDEHARVLALDPAKLPAARERVWEAVVTAEIHRDMGLADREARDDFGDDRFDNLIGELDGYLCELKDAQIRGGLHVLGQAPRNVALIDMILAITRLPQGTIPSLRDMVAKDMGIDLSHASRVEIDAIEANCRSLVEALARKGWLASPGDPPVLGWIADKLVPALAATTDEIDSVLAALDGRFVAPGPSGAPTRGMAHVLPTGRNFYTLDPRSVPSQLSWEVGQSLASQIVDRYMSEEGRYPTSIGLVVWGTAAMRTSGDDIAEALALLGVRPVWDTESSRVTGLEVIDVESLGRPRVGVTLRISGFFRDAFAHLIGLFEEAVAIVAARDEPDQLNPLAAEHRRGAGTADPRVFGPKPGAYGSGILPLIDSGEWDGDHDLAEVYLTWGGYAYGGEGSGEAAPDAVRRRLAAVDVAVKNQDNREHDIFDSDDYLQDHGGMIAAIRALTGRSPKAYFGDTSRPESPRVRDLKEEAARVVRSRVVNPTWIEAMRRHGYKGAFEMAATVDYLFGYDATAEIAEDWMYEKITERYVADPSIREFFRRSNPAALTSIAERLLEAVDRGLWEATEGARAALRSAVLEAEGWEESGR